MVGAFLEQGLQDFAAFALVGKSTIGLGRSNGQGERVKDGSFVIIGIGSLKVSHLPFEDARAGRAVLLILTVDLAQRVNVAFLASRGFRIGRGFLLGPQQRGASGGHVSVVP